MRRVLILLAIPFLAGCVFQSPRDLVTPAAAGEPQYVGLRLDRLGTYRARFTMSFEGQSTWWYRVDLMSDGVIKAYELSMEGLPQSRDPGDVKLVDANGVLTLQGDATAGECWRFPASANRSREPLTPDGVIQPARIATDLKDAGRETILGRTAERYTLDRSLRPEFSRADISIWLDSATGAVLRYQFTLEGSDPLFDAGEGTLSGEFDVLDLRAVTIDPIEGCESEFPVPDDGWDIYLLSDYVGYRTGLSPDELVEFMLQSLGRQGWQQAADTEAIPGTAALSFRRGATALEIFIQSEAEWTKVEIFQAPVSEP